MKYVVAILLVLLALTKPPPRWNRILEARMAQEMGRWLMRPRVVSKSSITSDISEDQSVVDAPRTDTRMLI